MSSESIQPKLPGPQAMAASSSSSSSATAPASPAVAMQLKDLSLPELQTMAREYGLDPSTFDTKPAIVAAILDRRTLIASLERDALLDVLHWARRPTPSTNAARERLAMDVIKVRTMRFSGLSQRGLLVLAKLRGVEVDPRDSTPQIIDKLKGQEGLFAKIARKRRQMVGRWVSRMVGETSAEDDAATAAASGPATGDRPTATSPTRPPQERKLQDEIEESGLIAGLTSRMRRSADQYLNQKLDEIEARIDRKLDEIDRRLAEWRDKEVANRIRILKISLWATVVVGAATLIISYLRVYMPWLFGG